ncbi:MAG TPA: transposase [Dehalococcoidia bacterium]|nr:transposase [Dehalococcoidia bacterium]
MDHQPRPRIYPKKGARDRLIRLATTQPDWALGFEDETWFSRLAQPSLHTWTDTGVPWRLVEQSLPKDDPGPKALACYGLMVRWQPTTAPPQEEVWLRFVEGRPISGVTLAFLEWVCRKLEALGKKALLLVWDNASWHISKKVKDWIREHNCPVKGTGQGVRILSCPLPTKSPWLNPIEPRWIHAKRRVVEADRLLSGQELAQRVCDDFGCAYEEHLTLTEKVA